MSGISISTDTQIPIADDTDGKTSRSLLALTKSTSLSALVLAHDIETGLVDLDVARTRSEGTRLLEEVDEDGGRSVVAEPLAELDKCDSHRLPGDFARDSTQRLHLLQSWLVLIAATLARGGELSALAGKVILLVVDYAGSASLGHDPEVLIERVRHVGRQSVLTESGGWQSEYGVQGGRAQN